MADVGGPAHAPPSDTAVAAVVCFTGVHARLPQLLATLNRSGLPLAVRRCKTLLEFARGLTGDEVALVGIDCGPGNPRLADALGIVRRAGRPAPVVVMAADSPQARALVAGLDRCQLLSPDDLPGLADLVRRLIRTGAGAARQAVGTAPAAVDTPTVLANQQALLDTLRKALLANAARAALVVIRMAPEPGAPPPTSWLPLLDEVLGSPAMLARLDGGGFGALVELADPAAGVALAHGVRETLLERLRAAGAERPAVAIGISPPRATDGDRPEDWLARTLEACDLAGRTEHGYAVLSRIPVTTPSARDLPGLLQEALVGNQLQLQFQPIVSLRGDARQHYETLVRLPSANAGELLPGDFFGPARTSGLLPAVDQWVIRHAIRRLKRERATNRHVQFFIPLSAQTLADERVLLAICDELRDAQATGDWLTFQLRPADVKAHPVQTRHLVKGLRQIRCRLALDHYDGDTLCREVLQAIAFDFAKLPPLLTRELHRDPARLDRLRGVIGQLEKRGVKCVATGLEDAQSLVHLWAVGVDYAQGFFLLEPTATIAYEGSG